MLPQLQAGIPPSVKLTMVSDRSLSISASFSDVKITLGFTIVLVVLVIFAFLRSFWATVIPSLTGSEVEHMHLPDEARPRAAFLGDQVHLSADCPRWFLLGVEEGPVSVAMVLLHVTVVIELTGDGRIAEALGELRLRHVAVMRVPLGADR
jgi:AcrB/AcrD/AcrF family